MMLALIGALLVVAGFLTMASEHSSRSLAVGAALFLTGAAIVFAIGLNH
jgi:hypothetical protein